MSLELKAVQPTALCLPNTIAYPLQPIMGLLPTFLSQLVAISAVLTVLGHLLRSIVQDRKFGAVKMSATSESFHKLRYQALVIFLPGKAECGFT